MTDEVRTPRPRPYRFVVALLIAAVVVGIGFWLVRPSLATLQADAQAALEARDARLAMERTQRLISRAPESVDAWSLRAQAGFLARDRGVWEPAIDRIETTDPGKAFDLWVTVGGQEMRRLNAASAELAFRRAIAISRDRPEPWRLLSQLIAIQGRPRETAECLLALIRLGDFSTADLQMLARPNSAIDDPSRVQALLESDPRNLVPMLSSVGSALNENQIVVAEQSLRTILARHPDNGRAQASLGRLLAERDADEFLHWQRGLTSNASIDPETWIAQGIWLRNHGQSSAAAACFHRAVEIDPRHLNAASELGLTLQTIGESSLAAEYLDWARIQQEITEIARRVEERGEPQNVRLLIERLERVGRLWEAWAWSRLYVHAYPDDEFARKDLERLHDRLAPDLPRTVPDVVPGRNFDWLRLAEPNWSIDGSKSNAAGSISETSLTAKSSIEFIDEAVRLGIVFHYENGPATSQTIVQTSGGGVAALDYDRDGWCDLYFTQGGHDLKAPQQTVIDSLFRNVAGERFEDVTGQSTIHEDTFSQGVAVGDIDSDGFPDLFVANLGQNRLLHNNGDGTFADVTAAAGLRSRGWTTSCAIADLNNDGHPELFSVRYAGGPEITSRVCRDQTGRPSVCRPSLFPAEPDLVAVNTGDGRFTEHCEDAGLDLPDGRGFGLIVADFNGDRRLDVFVANDLTANYLLIQSDSRDGQLHFSDEAIVSGAAFDRDGYPQACMGVAAGDINADGRPDLFITNFADESNTLYVSQPHGGYQDMTRQYALRDAGFRPLGFGTQFLDADVDGQLDLVVLNGHIHDASDPEKSPALRPMLFQGRTNDRFAQVLRDDPECFFNTPRIGRGLCVLDWNRDGLPDFAGSFLDGNAVLATNHSRSNGHWLAMQFVGVESSRDPIGTRVRLTFADGTQRLWQLIAGDGFAASNERRLHLGLGAHSVVTLVEVDWPSGLSQRFTDVSADALWVAIEGRPRLRKLPQNDIAE
jgi:tetratricopeptide (TPR) repeat protein